MKKTILFCLNHAGGSAAFYNPLGAHLPAYIHFQPLELPGHGAHLNETLLDDFTAMTNEVCKQINACLEKHKHPPYAIFGHSLGASLAFNAMHSLQGQGYPYYKAQLLCLSSPRALQSPLVPLPEYITASRLKFEDFKEYFQKEIAKNKVEDDMQEILQNPQFMAYIEPIIKADLKALDSWTPPLMPPLDIPILILHGKSEKYQAVHRWATRTTQSFSIKTFEGGHLYMLNQWQELANCLDMALQGALEPKQSANVVLMPKQGQSPSVVEFDKKTLYPRKNSSKQR